MATYVTIDQAKEHVREFQPARLADLTLKLDQAEAIILDYVAAGRTRREDPTLPGLGTAGGAIIGACVLDLLAGLYEHRGDDYGLDVPDFELWNAIARKLARLRDPAIA